MHTKWPKIILLDVDNTINNHFSADAHAKQALFTEIGKQTHISIEKLSQDYNEIADRIKGNCSSGNELRRARFKLFLEKNSINYISVEKIIERFESLLVENIKWVDDGLNTLKTLISNCSQLHLVTSSYSDIQYPLLQKLGLPDDIVSVNYLHDLNLNKKTGEAWKHIININNIVPMDTLVIGDNWDADCIGASKAGLPHIWFNRLNKINRKFSPLYMGEIREFYQILKIFDNVFWPIPYGEKPFLHYRENSNNEVYEDELSDSEKKITSSIKSVVNFINELFLKHIVENKKNYKISFGEIIGSIKKGTYYISEITDYDILLNTLDDPSKYPETKVQIITAELLELLAGSEQLKLYLSIFGYDKYSIIHSTPSFEQDRYWLVKYYVKCNDNTYKICDLNIGHIYNALSYEECFLNWLNSSGCKEKRIIISEIRLAKKLRNNLKSRHPILNKVSSIFLEQMVIQFGIVSTNQLENACLNSINNILKILSDGIKLNISPEPFYRPTGLTVYPNKKLVNFFDGFDIRELGHLTIAFKDFKDELKEA